MKEFCEKKYETLIANLLHDTHYLKSIRKILYIVMQMR